MRRTFTSVIAIGLCGVPFVQGSAQLAPAMTRSQAMAAALAHNPRLAAAAADTAAARARLTTAGVWPDPTLSLSYTKSAPQYHVTAEMPLDQLWLRGGRVGAARASQEASLYRLRYAVASLMLDVDTAYTRALAAVAHSRLSTRNARDSDSLRRMVIARRDVGDASDMDVDLATLTAGQQANAAAADSATAQAALLTLQALVGLTTDRIGVAPSDSLDAPAGIAAAGIAPLPPDPPLLVASSTAALQAATLNARVQHRNVFGSPGVIAGFETHDPSGAEPGLLPTVGIALPLPLFNRNRGPIAEADAERARAVAELQVAKIESRTQIGRARATLVVAGSRLVRDRDLLQSADRVTAKALIAYREGAFTLANVLEAQRTAREVQTQYVDDVANALIAAATLRLLTLTPSSVVP